MKIGFIGAGKVGFSLGKYFAENGMEISGYFSRSENSAKEAAEFTFSDFFDSCEKLINASDTVFLTVPDGAICETYLALPKDMLNGKQLCHCSGAMQSAAAFPDIAINFLVIKIKCYCRRCSYNIPLHHRGRGYGRRITLERELRPCTEGMVG